VMPLRQARAISLRIIELLGCRPVQRDRDLFESNLLFTYTPASEVTKRTTGSWACPGRATSPKIEGRYHSSGINREARIQNVTFRGAPRRV
jgi:hypothetical protein